MSCYISSNQNRFYAGSESSYGETPTIGSSNRLPAVKLSIKTRDREVIDVIRLVGVLSQVFPTGLRRKTEYQLRTYLTTWSDATDQPGYGPLFRAAMGSAPLLHSGATIADGSSNVQLRFNAGHGLTAGQAVSVGGELRFVSAVESDTAVELNAPLSDTPVAGYVDLGPPSLIRLERTCRALLSSIIGHPWNPFSGSFAVPSSTG